MAAQVAFRCTATFLVIGLFQCPTPTVVADVADLEKAGAAQALIDSTKSSNVFHLDLLVPRAGAERTPWFDGFDGQEGEQGAVTAGAVAVATIGHPILRILLHLRQEGVGLEEAISWAERGKSTDPSSSHRQGYQIVDNYLVRALGGKSAWDLPPGDVGKTELQAARVALGKFEVLLRAGCIAVDLPLLQPYLATPAPAAELEAAARETTDFLESGEAYYLELGSEGGKLLRGNRWDLQLWDFARDLVESRSTSVESYLCDSSTAARRQRMPGEGRRAVVYNSPSFHITGVAMFSCVLMSLGFDVTAVIKEPGAGFQHLLPCPDRVVTLDDHYLADTPGEILDEETAAALSLPTALTAEQEEQRGRQQVFYEENQRLKKQEEEEELRRQQEQQELEKQEQEREQEQGQEHDQDADQDQEEEGADIVGDGARGRRRGRSRRRATIAPQSSSPSSSSLAGLPSPGDELGRFGREEVDEREEEDEGKRDENEAEGDGEKEMEGSGGGHQVREIESTRSSSKVRGRRRRTRSQRDLMTAAAIQQEQGQQPQEGSGGGGGGGSVSRAPTLEQEESQRAEQPRATPSSTRGAHAKARAEAQAQAQARPHRRHRLGQTTGDNSASRLIAAAAKEDGGEKEFAGNGGRRRRTGEGEGEGEEQQGSEGEQNDNKKSHAGTGQPGPFDLSVLCTAVNDVNHLMKATYPVDPRIADALLWGVDVSIWNIHSVEAAFRSDHRVPPSVNNFVRGVPSMEERGGGGRVPPQKFLTLYGEHVEQWERWSEEAYEGWGWAGGEAPGVGTPERGRSTLGGLFRRPGVVYPIHPTGHLRLPRPKRPFAPPLSPERGLAESSVEGEGGVREDWEKEEEKESDEKREDGGEGEIAVAGRKEDVVFVVQGNMQSYRRDYPMLVRCLEAMCSSGRDNYQLVAVGARGDLPEEMGTKACVEERTTEWRHLEYPEFYANISAGHFVVTAAAGHDYEYDKATSTVPTALLLERPLVMSSTLLDAYPCLRKSRVHSMVANDDLCLNLQAAYDLTTAEYDEMELEARDCKLEMWRHARETVAAMASGWTLD